MTRVGILSDTHGYLDPAIPDHFQGVDQIVHAGDVGPEETIEPLARIAPLTAVIGNTDTFLPFPVSTRITIESQSVWVQHIVEPGKLPNPSLLNISAVVFGHTHRTYNAVVNGVQFINPGYAGRPRKGTDRSVAIVLLDKASLQVRFIRLD